MLFIRKCRIPTGAIPTSASSTAAADPCRPFRWRWCRSRGATGSATPSGRPARRRTTSCSQCWQASRPCAARACGVRVTPAWDEPLVLWQAVVGEPSTGKSAALAPMRRLLDRRRAGAARRRRGAARGASWARWGREGWEGRRSRAVRALAGRGERCRSRRARRRSSRAIRAACCCGATVRRRGSAPRDDDEDDSHRATWLAAWEARRRHRGASAPAGAIVAALSGQHPRDHPARAAEGGAAARATTAWPRAFCSPGPARSPIAPSRWSSARATRRSCSACARCRGWRRSADDPCVLDVDARGRAALDKVLAALHAERQNVEGLEAAWLGKSRSLIVRLAGVLELLGSIDGKAVRPGAIGAEQVEAAAALWRDYFWPHAKAVFDSAELSDHAKRVRRVARWLLDEAADDGIARGDSPPRAQLRRRRPTRPRACCSGCTISATSSPISPIATSPAGRPTAGWSIRRWRNLKTGSGNSGTVRNDIFCRIVGACPERSRRILLRLSWGARPPEVRLSRIAMRALIMSGPGASALR